MSSTIFGYGCLILPHSLVRRLTEIVTREEIYGKERTKDRENVILDKEQQVWKSRYKNRITFTPVYITGFIRAYTLESIDGGTKIQAYQTGRNEDILNGVIITGLTQDEQNKISTTEKDYTEYTVKEEQVRYYDKPTENTNISSITIYLPDSQKSNLNTDKLRNKTYHSRVLRGIENLKEQYGDNVYRRFMIDFANNTYERPSDTFDAYSQIQSKNQ